LADECALPEERVTEATACYEALKKLESSNFDVRVQELQSGPASYLS
jgi:hypothetical protein